MLMFDRRLVSHFDFALLALALGISAIGLATILSATYTPGHVLSSVAIRQLVWAIAGTGALIAAVLFDYHVLERYAYAIYSFALFLLMLVPIIGSIGGGS